MTATDPFLRAILDDPSDDGPRLVYADWLDERGEAARAEFIRVQCELARLGPPHIVVSERCVVESRYGPNYYSLTGGEGLQGGGRLILEVGVGDRVDVLKPRGRKTPLYGLRVSRITDDEVVLVNDPKSGAWPGEALRRCERELLELHWHPWSGVPRAAYCMNFGGTGALGVEFHRGFVSSVTLTLDQFMGLAANLFAVAPVTRVTLSDREPAVVRELESGARYVQTPDGGTNPIAAYSWWRHDANSELAGWLPEEIWRHLLPRPGRVKGYRTDYDTREFARTALSDACVAHGRSVATGMTHPCERCNQQGYLNTMRNDAWETCTCCSGKVGIPGLPSLRKLAKVMA